MKALGILLSLALLCLSACDSEKKSPDNAGSVASPVGNPRIYFLSVETPDPALALTKDNFTVATLLPLPAKPADAPTSTIAGGSTGTPASQQPFTELSINILKLTRLDSGLYKLRLSEPPQADGVIRVKLGNTVLEALMLTNGTEKRPLQIDTLSTAAVRMFLSRVMAQRSFNGVDTEQVNTMLSVVRKHLETLDVPDKLDVDKRIAWYAEQAHKACTIRFSALSSSAECAAFTLGGEVKGLTGQLQLVLNHGEPLQITENGPFLFPIGLINRALFEVTVKEQPNRQTCTVKYGVGRIHAENVDSVIVQCEENRYQLAGMAEGITGPVKLTLNGNVETLTLRKDGVFQFTKTLQHGAAYEITLAQQPQELTCALSHGAGYVSDNVGNIAINCEPLLFQVGGGVNGLHGNLKLKINDKEEITLSQDGEFAFSTDFVHKENYNIQVVEQPLGQTCQITKAQGRLVLSDIKNVAVDCQANQHTLGGRVEGLKSPLTLTLNGEENLTLNADGEFRFKTALPFGNPYAVTVTAPPKGQQCKVKPAEGTIAGDATDLLVECAVVKFRLGGVVSGLSGAFQLRLNNRQEVLAIPGNGPFEFATRLVGGERYTVVMDTQPAGQYCVLTNGNGRIGGQDSKSLRIECDFQSFKLGGMVSGLKGSLKLVLNGGKESLALSSNGMFAFSSALQIGEHYNVTVESHPNGQWCDVRKGQGSIVAANIVDVRVQCVQGSATPTESVSSRKPSAEGTPGSSTSATPASSPAPEEEGPQTYAAPFPQVNKP